MTSYLKVVFIALSIALGCQSEEKIRDTSSLPIPRPKYLETVDPAHVIVKWDPVEVSEDNPILGFKVKLWEDQKMKVYKYVQKDGERVLVEELVPVQKSFHVLPTHEPAFTAVVPPDVFTTSFDVKIGEHYEVRAQSFNAHGDGPLSNSYGFKINPSEEDLNTSKSKS